MKRILRLLLIVWVFMPLNLFGQSYDGLWKQVHDAENSDLPRTQMDVLDKIIQKAEKDKNYGQLIAARLRHCKAMVMVSPDSLMPSVDRLKQQALDAERHDPALAAVLNSVLGMVYENNPRLSDDYVALSRDFFNKSLRDPQMLANHHTIEFDPLIEQGVDSEVFNNDLLHLLGYQAGEYKTLYNHYMQKGNRRAALFCALKDVEKRYAGKQGTRMATSKYAAALDSLITQFGDLPECGEVAIARSSFMGRCSDVSAEEHAAYIHEASERWSAWERVKELQNTDAELRHPWFSLSFPHQLELPGKTIPVMINSIKNVPEVQIKVVRLNHTGESKIHSSEKDAVLKMVSGSERIYTKSFTYRNEYETRHDSMEIEPLPVGVYLVEVTTPKTKTDKIRRLIYVSNLRCIEEALPDKRIRYVVVNATTGQPVPGAKLKLSISQGYRKDDKVVTLTCDKQGEAIYSMSSTSDLPARVFATAGDDCYLPDRSGGYALYNYYEDKYAHDHIQLYTDREIYRPGQMVHVAMMAHQRKELETHAIANRQYRVALRDANYQLVEEKNVTTDSYGSAAADFTLPTGGLTGRFTIQVGYTTKSVRVEEYKRPTFEVEFEPVKENYQVGDIITVTGHAKTYAGVPVQGAKVKYSVNRAQAWWWRWGSSRDDNELIEEDELTTDSEGAFKIEIPMLLPDWVDEEDFEAGTTYRYPRFYTFNVSADVTDQGGETHAAETRVPLGSKPTAFSLTIDKKSEKKNLKDFRFNRMNAAGQEIPGTVTYTIDGRQPQTANANESVPIDALALTSGRHVIEATCGEDTLKEEFIVFALDDKVPCVETHDWFYQTDNVFPRDGKPVTVQVGASDRDTHIVYTLVSGKELLECGTMEVSNGVASRSFTYQESYGSGIQISYAWVKEGVIYTHSATIARPLPDKQLKVKWVTFRDMLTPGQKEEWTLQVTHPDGTPAQAQFMATMYDKSLDQLASTSWGFYTGIGQSVASTFWRYSSYGSVNVSNSIYYNPIRVRSLKFSSFSDEITQFASEFSFYGIRMRSLGGRVTRLGAVRGDVLETVEEMAMPMMSKATADETAYAADNANGQMAAVKKKELTADTEAGVDDGRQMAEAQVRENLNETAFFYPDLVTDEQGQVAIRFTLPESVTTWQFLGLAHDTEMNYGMLRDVSVAKKDVMVQPNMPRFLRMGDKATITTKVFNTADKDVEGKVGIQLIDPETEQTVLQTTQSFKVKQGETTHASFEYEPNEKTPSLLICKIIAYGESFSDGEQHYLPVLPNSEWVTNTVPFTQHEPGVKVVDLKKLIPANAREARLTVEYTNNPAWLMVQTLPFVGSVNEHNAVSLAAAYYANQLGAHLIAQVPQAKHVFEQWQREEGSETSLMSALEKNQDLKALVLSETPWVMDAKSESGQKKALVNFFDENALNHRVSSALTSLKKLQRGSGAFSWWEGMPDSPAMTAEVLEFLTRLNLLIGKDSQTEQILKKANSYLSKVVIDEVNEMKQREKKGEKIYIWYSHALQWVYINAIAGQKLTSQEQAAVDYLLSKLEKTNTKQSMYAKAKMAVVLARNGRQAKADEYLKSLKEYMVYTDEMGRYFDTPRTGYSWCDYRIPAQTAVIEAWQLLRPSEQQIIAEMQRWLLMQKRTQNWDTPINCVNAVFAFLNNNTSMLANQEQTVLKVDGKVLDLPKATAGMGYVKTVLPAEGTARFEAEKTSAGTSWGAVYAQFFQPTSSIKEQKSGMKVTRQLLTADNKPVGNLKVGDRIKVRLTIQADRDYDYVQLVDKRAACMEPIQQLSGYHWGYYCAPKDNATCYYFDILSKGSHVIETEYFIDRPGVYETGTCVVQCAYSPEYMGRTQSQTLVIQ